MAWILIVEDDRSISDLIRMNLELVGYDCVQVYDGAAALSVFENGSFDLVMLDVMLPRTDGFSLMEKNAFGGTPVIFVTAKAGLNDRVKGLKLGADDYIVKPFEAVELLARVEAVLRRVNKAQNEFTSGNTTVHLDSRTVTVNGGDVGLTNREFELLRVLIANRNIALSREKLLDLAWGYDYYGDPRTVDVHITKLRKKLCWEDRIKTVYRMGYRLEYDL